MQINKIKDRAIKYINSFFYPLTLMILAFFMWYLPTPWNLFPIIIYSLLSFLPIFGKQGKPYLPLMLLLIAVSSNEIKIDYIPLAMLIPGISIALSCLIFILVQKKKMILGKTFFSMIFLFLTFIISYMYNMITKEETQFFGFSYITLGLFIILISVFICTVLGREESLSYFSTSLVLLAILVTLESYTSILNKGPLSYADTSFSLGWAQEKNLPSTILVLSLPFISILINKKKYLYILPAIFIFSGIILLSSSSSLLVLTMVIIPLIFLTFRNEGKRYSYFILFAILVVAGTISIFISLDKSFNTNFINAIRSLNPLSSFPEGRYEIYQEAVKQFVSSPVFGISVAGRVANDSVILANNSILTTALFGGSLGIIAYIVFLINLYLVVIFKKCKERYLFLLYLIMMEIIGFVDNAFYCLPIFFILAIAVSTYQMSKKPSDTIIHQDSYQLETRDLLDQR